MSLRRFLQTNPNAEDARSSLEDDRPPSYTFIDTVALTHTGSADSPNDRARNVSLPGRDSDAAWRDRVLAYGHTRHRRNIQCSNSTLW